MDQQRMAALARANEVRFARAQLKRDLLAGRTTLADALTHEHAQTMRVWDLLLALRKWGPSKAMRCLNAARVHSVYVSGARLVRDLTDRERDALAGMVSGYPPRISSVRSTG